MTKVTQNIAILDREINHPSVWHRSTISPKDWLVSIDTAGREEILRWLRFIRQHPLPVLLRSPDQFEMPHCRSVLERIRQILEQGVHLTVLDGLPLDEMDVDEAKTLGWILCAMLGRLVPQKWDGKMIYDVRDEGTPYTIGVRASVTNVGLDFHTDTPFNDYVPRYVGLLCLQPAPMGGLSRALSLAIVHNIMRARFRQHLHRLYEPFYFDRQMEHTPNESRSRKYPIFAFSDRLQVRCNTTLIRNGYYLAGDVLDEASDAALAAFQDVLSDESLWWEHQLQRGQMQFINNVDVAHTRTAFQDADDPSLKRHLVRYWIRDEGAVFFL